MKTAIACLALTTAAVCWALPAVAIVGGVLVVGWVVMEAKERGW